MSMGSGRFAYFRRALLLVLVAVSTGCTSDAPLLDQPDRGNSKEQIDAILDRAIEAHGGESKLHEFRCARVVVRMEGELSPDGGLVYENTFRLPDQLRQVISWESKGKKCQDVFVWNGKEQWAIMGGRIMDNPQVPNRIRQVFPLPILDTLLPVREGNFDIRRLADTTINGRRAVVLKVLRDGEWIGELCFDADEKLLLQWSQPQTDPFSGAPTVRKVLLENFREMEGLKLPTKMTSFLRDQKHMQTTVLEFELLNGIDPQDLAKPSAPDGPSS